METLSDRVSGRAKWVVAVFAALMVLSTAAVAAALSCIAYRAEHLSLELERVEIDGQVQTAAPDSSRSVVLGVAYEDRVELRVMDGDRMVTSANFERQEVTGE